MSGTACEEGNMDLKTLQDSPPWDWPHGAGTMFLGILRDNHAAGSDRLLAAELAGDVTLINGELVGALLSILRNGAESEKFRGQAAISLRGLRDRATGRCQFCQFTSWGRQVGGGRWREVMTRVLGRALAGAG